MSKEANQRIRYLEDQVKYWKSKSGGNIHEATINYLLKTATECIDAAKFLIGLRDHDDRLIEARMNFMVSKDRVSNEQ